MSILVAEISSLHVSGVDCHQYTCLGCQLSRSSGCH